MPKQGSPSDGRKPRTDAQRNRKRILEVAKQAFTPSGTNASLDDIAKTQVSVRERCIATFPRVTNF